MKVSELKVIDVILMPEFEQGMQLCIDDINRRIMLALTNGPLKRGPIDRLKEIGDAVLHRTVEYLKAKEENIETIMVKKED